MEDLPRPLSRARLGGGDRRDRVRARRGRGGARRRARPGRNAGPLRRAHRRDDHPRRAEPLPDAAPDVHATRAGGAGVPRRGVPAPRGRRAPLTRCGSSPRCLRKISPSCPPRRAPPRRRAMTARHLGEQERATADPWPGSRPRRSSSRRRSAASPCSRRRRPSRG